MQVPRRGIELPIPFQTYRKNYDESLPKAYTTFRNNISNSVTPGVFHESTLFPVVGRAARSRCRNRVRAVHPVRQGTRQWIMAPLPSSGRCILIVQRRGSPCIQKSVMIGKPAGRCYCSYFSQFHQQFHFFI